MLIPILYLMAATTTIPSVEPATPSRQPQLAAAHGIVAMTFGSGSKVYYASSPDQGKTWNAPVKVVEAGSLALGRHRGPRLAILKDSLVISAIVGAKGVKQAGTLTTFRSTDGGKSWTPAGVVNDVPEAAREGLHAMTAGPDGTLFAAWLDMRAKGTQLYGSKSTDGGLTWSKNVAVYSSPEGTICQCCHPTVTIDATGRIYAMWRNVIDGSRDFYVAASLDGVHFEGANKLGEGTWKLNACPMDGGGLAVEDGGKLTSAWRRDGDIFLTEPGVAAERKVGTGKDVALVRAHHQTYLAWTDNGGIHVLIPKSATPVKIAEEGGFPSLIALEDGSILAAWETHSTIQTQRLP